MLHSHMATRPHHMQSVRRHQAGAMSLKVCDAQAMRTKEIRLDLALRLVERVAEHLGLDGQVLDLQHAHQPLDAVPAKHAEQAARISKAGPPSVLHPS